MKRLTVIIVITLVILGIALYLWFAYMATHTATKPSTSTSQTTVSKPVSPSNKSSASDTLLGLVNDQRKKANVPALAADSKVASSAQWKVDDMMQNNYLGYIKPGDKDKNGINKLFELTGNDCQYGNEIMVWDSDKVAITPDAAVNWWMSTESYRNILLDKGYTKTGFGIGQYVIVEHFCQP